MGDVVSFTGLETLTREERIIYDWQYYRMGDFSETLMKAIMIADENNLELLSKGFPDHVNGYLRYVRERGWWENIKKKMGV